MATAPSYEVRMAMRIMLRTGLRVSECLSLRPADLRLNLDPPILSLRPDVLGKKAKRGREVPVPADLVESPANLKSFHRRDRNRPLFDISRNWVSKSMKEEEAGIDPAKDHPHALRHTYGRKRCSAGCRLRCSRLGWDTCPWWAATTSGGWKGSREQGRTRRHHKRLGPLPRSSGQRPSKAWLSPEPVIPRNQMGGSTPACYNRVNSKLLLTTTRTETC